MQTFLPYPDFHKISLMLDRVRCFKQAIETRQILVLLGETIYKTLKGKKLDKLMAYSKRHENHAAKRMWIGHNKLLKIYHDFMLHRAINHWKYKTYPYYLVSSKLEELKILFESIKKPDWFDNSDIYLSHQSNLVRKNPFYYRELFPDVEDSLEYVWPIGPTHREMVDKFLKDLDELQEDSKKRIVWAK